MAKPQVITEDDDVKAPAEELVIVEKKPEPVAKVEDDDDEDEHPDTSEKDVNPDDPDDKEREAIRERRRLEKIERKERREKAIQRDKLELEFLSKRNAELERRFNSIEQRQFQADVSNVDAQLRSAINEFDMAEKVIAKAVAAGNGDDVAQAMRYRDQAMAKAQQLKAIKDRATAPRPVAPPAQQGMDETTLNYAREFVKENSWYDPQGRDEDSAVVLAIDQTLVKDGFQPNTSEYWAELRKRAARRLPEKFKAADDRQARGGPALGSGKEHAPTSSRREVYISPERKAALEEAGVWADPILRMKYVKRYAEYDRLNKNQS